MPVKGWLMCSMLMWIMPSWAQDVSEKEAVFTQSGQIIKSVNDTREFAYKTLKNGLKLLVISDKEAPRAAVAVDVAVGSSADPNNFLGLAHFLEHMLFLGTDRYPTPDEFSQYITQHGGSNNAFTAFENTNYYFNIDPQYLQGGLARFARFFVAPLMQEDYVAREREAVNSEYRSKLQAHFWRNNEVYKQALNPAHPFSRFNVGSLETLPAENVRPALLDFYQKYYSADRMSAVIIGRENTQTLMQWGEEAFSFVPKREKVTKPTKQTKLFAGVNLPILLENKTLQPTQSLTLNFALPYTLTDQYHKVWSYLAYILGYEGEGSLAQTLKKQGLISELFAGIGQKMGDEVNFSIGVKLTPQGYAEQEQVLAMIFAYLDLLRQETQGEKRYQALATLMQREFQFREKIAPIDEVSHLAMNLNQYPAQDVLALGALYQGYDAEKIQQALSFMQGKNAVVQVSAPQIESAQRTPYFHVPYKISPLNLANIQLRAENKSWLEKMHLPKENAFIADDYRLQKASEQAKEMRLPNGIMLYFQHNTQFNVPRSVVEIALQPKGELSAQEKVAMTLFARLFNESLNTQRYDASLAGLYGSLSASPSMWQLSLQGYSQKMPELLQTMLQHWQNFQVDPALFQRVKQDYQQELQNFATFMPFKQTLTYLNVKLYAQSLLPKQKSEALDTLNAENILPIVHKLMQKMAVKMLVYGNNHWAQAEDFAQILAKNLATTNFKTSWEMPLAPKISQRETQNIEVDHADNAISFYLPWEQGPTAQAEVALLAQMLKAEFFNSLRTEQQLGYIVFAGAKPVYQQAGMVFVVESPKVSAQELKSRILTFKQDFAQQLALLSQEKFIAQKAILQTELLQKPQNLAQSAERYWQNILLTGETKSHRQKVAKALETLTLADFSARMQKFLQQNRFVEINAIGKKAKEVK